MATILDFQSILNAKEYQKFIKKFPAVASFIDDLYAKLALLREHGIVINRASELKVLANSLDVLRTRIDVMKNDINALECYVQNPILLNKDLFDLRKRIQYFRQNGMDIDVTMLNYSNDKWNQVIGIQNEKQPETVILEPDVNAGIQPTNAYDQDLSSINNQRKELESLREDLAKYNQSNGIANTTFEGIAGDLNDQLGPDNARENMARILDFEFNGEEENNFGGRVA